MPDVIIDSNIPAHEIFGSTVVENQKIEILDGDNLNIRVEMVFRNCEFSMSPGSTVNIELPLDVNSSSDQPTLEFDNCTITSCSGFWYGGFRDVTYGGFTTPTTTHTIIKNSRLYKTSELLHISGGSLTLTDNIIEHIDEDTHIVLLIGINNSDCCVDTKITGNYFYGDGVGISIGKSPDFLDFNVKIGSNAENPNIFITKEDAIKHSVEDKNLHLENSVIISNNYGVLFGGQNLTINNCNIQGSKAGLLVQNKNCFIQATNSNFYDSGLGIHSYSRNLEISNSSFLDNEIGIKTSIANPSSATAFINRNEFRNHIDIHSTGWTGGGFFAFNNDFGGSDIGFLGDGHNTTNFTRCDFNYSLLNYYGYATGGSLNLTDQNNFEDGYYGIHTTFDNDGFIFKNNCFDSELQDLNLNGSIKPEQGTEQVGAGNCFSGGIPDINANTNHFSYFVKNEALGTCKEPIYDSSYTVKESVSDDNTQCLGSNYPSNPSEQQQGCVEKRDYTCNEIKGIINDIIEDIEELESSLENEDSPYSDLNVVVSQSLIIELNQCLEGLMLLLPKHCESFPVEIEIIRLLENNQLNAIAIGLLIENQEYEAVNTFVSAIVERDEEFNDFLYTQDINIQLLTDTSRVVTSVELTNLYNIGIKTFTLSSYARALYTQITGTIIQPPMPTFESVDTRESSALVTSDVLTFYPNPVTTDITISCPDTATLYISDMLGNRVYQGIGSTQLSTLTWESGVYSIQMLSSNNLVTSRKFLKI